MLTCAFRRAAVIAPKVFSSQRCWSSTLPLLSAPCTSPCFFSTARPSFLLPRPPSRGPSFLAGAHPVTSSAKKRPKPEPPPREPDLLRYDMQELHKTPKPAAYLGYSILLPFVCPTLFMGVIENFIPELAYFQIAYGASFLSFWGGARWGFALPAGSPAKPDWMNLTNSVVPSLWAWGAVWMSDCITEGGIMLIMGLGIALHYDLARVYPSYPSWCKAQRAIQTIVAAVSLVGMLMVCNSYPEKRWFSEEKDK